MHHRILVVMTGLAIIASLASAEGRVRVNGATPDRVIVMMDPGDVDPTDLPLTPVTAFHSTGTPQVVSESRWRLTVTGKGVAHPLSLTLKDLGGIPLVSKRVILICPGFFYDYAEWEGVPLAALLTMAGAGNSYRQVSFTSVDGYTSTFTREEVESHLILIAIGANGAPLPPEHGFPARVVAEDLYGGRWVKYLEAITLE